MIKVLSIAGSDPSSGAGIQADLKTFQKLRAFGMAIPAALTVQSSRGVSGCAPVPAILFRRQLEALLSDIEPDAVKTGMLLTGQNIAATARALRKFEIRNLVIDPVLRASSGRLLLEPSALRVLKKQLFPYALIVTPNIPEAETLAGIHIRQQKDMDRAAGKILEMGPAFVLIKGGHRQGPATDTLYGGKTPVTFSTHRKKGDFHGTGCMLSSALTVFVARGYRVDKAVEKAKQFVDTMLKTAEPVGTQKTRYFQFV